MLPVLVSFGNFKIYTFGIFLVLAFFWASFLLWKNIRLTAFKEEEIFDSLFISFFIGLIAGRVMYVFIHFKEFGLDFLKILLVNGYPGISLYGVLIGFIFSLKLVFDIKKIKFNEAVDYFITPLLIALAIGKIGAFFSGVEVGTVTKFPFAIKYVGYQGFRHITSIYEAVFLFIIAFFSYKILFEIRREKIHTGFLLPFFGFFFALSNLTFGIIKASKDLIYKVNINSIFSLIILLTTAIYFLYYFRSLINQKIRLIINLLKTHGQKAIKGIIGRNPKKTGGREKKTDNTD